MAFEIFKRRRRKPELTILDDRALQALLRGYEDLHASLSGERVASAEFFDRYRDGLPDDLWYAMEWATYYELLRERDERILGDNGAGITRCHRVAAA